MLRSKINKAIKAILPRRFVTYRGKGGSKKIAITFDDGPDELNTSKILDVLKRDGVNATFFVQGYLAEKYPEIVKRISDEGHQLGNHGYRHDSCHKIGMFDYLRSADKTNALIKENTQSNSGYYFRPPYGDLKVIVALVLLLKGYKILMWSVDSKDSFVDNSDELLNHVKSLKLNSGDILLFHDDYSITLNALPAIISFIRDAGFDLVTVDEIRGL